MDDDDPQTSKHGDTLNRIASVLNTSVESFLAADPAPRSAIDERAMSNKETTEILFLLRAFVQLKAPMARARCLAFVKQELQREERS